MIDFKELQSEMKAWQKKNFPKSGALDCFLGVVEEVGELAHALLKGRQNIRHPSTEIKYKMRDAVGDIVIYLMNFCALMGWDFAEIVEETWAVVKQRNWQKYPKNGMTE